MTELTEVERLLFLRLADIERVEFARPQLDHWDPYLNTNASSEQRSARAAALRGWTPPTSTAELYASLAHRRELAERRIKSGR